MADSVDALFARFGPRYRFWVSAFGLCGSFATVLSATIANVAVPNVMGSFGIGLDQAQWIATAFITTMTVSQLLNHWMVEALGQRGTFLLIIVVFFVGSMIGWFAPNFDSLILARVLQGFAAGVMQPLVLVTMFSVFPPERRGVAMGFYGAGLLIAPGVGPVVGGMAIDAFDWRFIFLMPLPFCLMAFVGGAVFMPKGNSTSRLASFDWFGCVLLSATLLLLMTGAANGFRWGWDSTRVLVHAVGGLVCGLGFVSWELKSRAPMLDFGLWRNQRFTAALCIAFVFGSGVFAISYVIPVFVQEVQGYSATQAGAVMLPAGLMLVVVMPLTGRFADRVAYHVPIMLGLSFFAVGAGAMSLADVNTPFWTFAFYGCISQLGLAFLMPSLSVAALSALGPEHLFRGSGNVNFIRQLGGAVGTNLVVVWIQVRTAFHSDVLTATQTADNQTTQEFLAGVTSRLSQAPIPDELRAPIALGYLGRVLEAQALTLGFKDAFVALGLVFLLALIPAYLFSRTESIKEKKQ